jgi:hypothetical protein
MLVTLEDGCDYSPFIDDNVISLSHNTHYSMQWMFCLTFMCGNHAAIFSCISMQVSFESHTDDHLRAFPM